MQQQTILNVEYLCFSESKQKTDFYKLDNPIPIGCIKYEILLATDKENRIGLQMFVTPDEILGRYFVTGLDEKGKPETTSFDDRLYSYKNFPSVYQHATQLAVLENIYPLPMFMEAHKTKNKFDTSGKSFRHV